MIITNIIFNILLGFSIGLIVASLLQKKNKIHGPNSKEVIKKNYKNKKENKCYKFLPKIIKCRYFF